MQNNQEIIDLLLNFGGTDINLQDSDKDSALLNAFFNGHLQLFEYLITKGADVNMLYQNDNTLLMYAAKSGNLEAIKILLKYGADVDLVNKRRWKAEEMAAFNGQMNASWLIQNANDDCEVPQVSAMEEIEYFNELADIVLGNRKRKY
jgi:ankyrin repeat protein